MRTVVLSFALIIGIVAVLYLSNPPVIRPSDTTQEATEFSVGPTLNQSNTSDGSSDPEIAAYSEILFLKIQNKRQIDSQEFIILFLGPDRRPRVRSD